MKVAALRAAGVVPKPIVDTLMRLIRRTRWLITLRGVCATVAAAVGALLLVMAIDASVTLYSLSTRWILSVSAYAITVGAALWFLVRPLAHSFTLAGIARTIETRHPELQERISSAVELLTTDDAPELRGSEQLIGALVEQATDNVRAIQPRREVSLAAAKPFLVVAAAVVAILIGRVVQQGIEDGTRQIPTRLALRRTLHLVGGALVISAVMVLLSIGSWLWVLATSR